MITQCSPHPPERGEMKEECGSGGSMALTTQRTLSHPTKKGKKHTWILDFFTSWIGWFWCFCQLANCRNELNFFAFIFGQATWFSSKVYVLAAHKPEGVSCTLFQYRGIEFWWHVPRLMNRRHGTTTFASEFHLGRNIHVQNKQRLFFSVLVCQGVSSFGRPWVGAE